MSDYFSRMHLESDQLPLYLIVASENPVKVGAVKQAIEYTAFAESRILSVKVASGVSAQPRSDQETKLGAENRALNALSWWFTQPVNKKKSGTILTVGIEGGVFEDRHGQMWSTVWVVVSDQNKQLYFASGARFLIPLVVANGIRKGMEMGIVMANLMGEKDKNSVKTGVGMIGIITGRLIDRTTEHVAIIKMALGLWYGRNWQSQFVLGK